MLKTKNLDCLIRYEEIHMINHPPTFEDVKSIMDIHLGYIFIIQTIFSAFY